MSFLRPTIKDVRDRRVPLARHETMLPGTIDPERRERLQRVQRIEPRLSAREIVTTILLLLPVVLVAGIVPVATTSWLRLPGYVFMPVAIMAGVLVPASLIVIMRRTASRHLAAMYLDARMCPSCGYDLESITPDTDANRTCPECGAAWRLP